MDDFAARERWCEQRVQYLLVNKDEPISNLLQAFGEYRQICQTGMLAKIEYGGDNTEANLWAAHTEGKKYFNRALKEHRKQGSEQVVATRQLMKLYLQFLKDSESFYRTYIHKLCMAFPGIPELEEVLVKIKAPVSGESSQRQMSPAFRKKVVDSAHRTLIYLGDLSRYRASEQLDKKPTFSNALGFYGVACLLCPSSGLGHHQQAVIALEQQHHLTAIYHLYRAIVVNEPHPLAPQNLRREFDKTNTAWDRGELIQKGPPNDPENSRRMLIGWFVRLHSMCVKGVMFKGFAELEREVLGQLASEVKNREVDNSFMRMVMTNMAAQSNSKERFQENPTNELQNAFLLFFRFNINTLTTLLRVFHEDLKGVDMTVADDEDDEAQLAARLTPVSRRLLPALRLYSSWLLPMVHIIAGLSTDELLRESIDRFWPIYARTIDRVAAVFPIWDLEEIIEITYLLEEDTESLGFMPLESEKATKRMCVPSTGVLKPRHDARGVQRASDDIETLARVKDFLADGLFLANDDEQAPMKLQGTRILHRDAEDVDLTVPPPHIPKPTPTATATAAKAIEPKVERPKLAQGPKKASYATAAATKVTKAAARPPKQPNGVGHPSTGAGSRHAQLSRMVDDLVDDEEASNHNPPITPPDQNTTNPGVVTKGDVSYASLPAGSQGFAQMPAPSYPQPKQKPIGTPPGLQKPSPKPVPASNAPSWRRAPGTDPWNNPSPFPSGLPTGTLSPPHNTRALHSRGNSATSVQSRGSASTVGAVGDPVAAWETASKGSVVANGGGLANGKFGKTAGFWRVGEGGVGGGARWGRNASSAAEGGKG